MQQPSTYKNCQSCGMPLKKDTEGGGTEKDGTRSPRYCSHCYRDGAFTMPDLTVEQMRERVIAKLKEFHFPGFLAKVMTRNLGELERWSK